MTTTAERDWVYAPFTLEQVNSLNEYQRAGVMHEFTCTNGHTLSATPEGWRCRHCPTYNQRWAWRWMADGSWRQMRLHAEP